MKEKIFYTIKIILITIFAMILLTLLVLMIKSGNQVSENTSFKKIIQKGKMIVGTEGAYPPFNYYNKENELISYDIDVMKEIAKRMDVKIEVKAIPWVNLFEELEKNKVDLIIAAITITPERSQKMLFSEAYFKTGQTILIKKSNTQINSPENLSDKKVGTQVGTTSTQEALKYASNIKFITYNKNEDAIKDLEDEILDAVILDYEVANQITKNNNELKTVGNLLSEEYYGIAMNRENIELMQKINEILEEMQEDGTIDELKKKWFN
jgi:ABC-type amino acid transport substrate-binding protein